MDTHHWITQIDKTTENFQNTFGSLSADALNWQPNAQTWSIAQNVDHLITINRTYFPILDKLKAGTYEVPFTGKIGFLVSFFGKFLLKAVRPERKMKTKTLPIWEPSISRIPGDILARFADHQERLKGEIRDAEDLLDEEPVISSPANRYFVYRLPVAFDIIVSHEQRHFNQAKEVLELMRQENVL